MKLAERICEYLKTSDNSDKFFKTLGKLAITYFIPDSLKDKDMIIDDNGVVKLNDDLIVCIESNTDSEDSNLIITEIGHIIEDPTDFINMTWGSDNPLKRYRNYTDSLIYEVISKDIERTNRILEGEPFSTTEYVKMVTSYFNDPVSDILKDKEFLLEIFRIQKDIPLEFHIKSLEPLLVTIGKILWEVYGTEKITNIHRYLITYNEPILVELEPNGFVAIKWVEDNDELKEYLKTGIGLEKVTIKDILRNEDIYDGDPLTDKSIEDVFKMRASKRFGNLSNMLSCASLNWVNEYFKELGKLISEMMAFNSENDYLIDEYIEGPSTDHSCFLKTSIDKDSKIIMEYSDDLVVDTVIFEDLDSLRTWYKKGYCYMIPDNFFMFLGYLREFTDDYARATIRSISYFYDISYLYDSVKKKYDSNYFEIKISGQQVSVRNTLQINLGKLLTVNEYYITNIINYKYVKELKEILLKKKKTYNVELRDKSNTYMKKGSIDAFSIDDAKSKFIDNRNEYPTIPVNSIWDWDTENIKVEERKDNN